MNNNPILALKIINYSQTKAISKEYPRIVAINNIESINFIYQPSGSGKRAEGYYIAFWNFRDSEPLHVRLGDSESKAMERYEEILKTYSELLFSAGGLVYDVTTGKSKNTPFGGVGSTRDV